MSSHRAVNAKLLRHRPPPLRPENCWEKQVGAGDSSSLGGNNTFGERKREKTTAYYIDEGVNGCFKDKVLCGVNFEPCPVAVLMGGRMGRGTAKSAKATSASAAPAEEKREGEAREKHHEEESAEQARSSAVEGRHSGDEGREQEQSRPVDEQQIEQQAEEQEPSWVAAAEARRDREPGGDDDGGDEDAVVMGPSGLPSDVVARKRLPKSLTPGDWLYFSRMGAYTASIATVTSSAVLGASYCYVASTPGRAGATARTPSTATAV